MAVDSLEEGIREMLVGYVGLTLVPNARITHASRMQDAALPSITFEIESIDRQAIGDDPLFNCIVSVSAIAETSVEALAVFDQVRSAMRVLTSVSVSPFDFYSVLYTSHNIEPVQVGDGDEHAPMVVVSTYSIFYTE